MPSTVTREDVLRLLDEEAAQLVEVLPRGDYDWAHLPGARHLPLEEIDGRAPRLLDRGRPVVAYCNNFEWDLSPRAAWRLERFGFRALDYAAGKMDWLSFGLPWEGTARLVGAELDPHVTTCNLDERVGDIRTRLRGDELCVVTNEAGIVAGVLTTDAARSVDPAARAEEAMATGPTTVRPSEEVEPLRDRMRDAGTNQVLVTRSDGYLMGVYRPSR
jgi:rhodanese-related sulfurtransferase